MTTYITAGQVSEKTGLAYSTIIEWALKGILPARIIPNGKKKKYLFIDKEIDAKLDRFRNKPL
jgi:predicted site-specific integrase-resolvase